MNNRKKIIIFLILISVSSVSIGIITFGKGPQELAPPPEEEPPPPGEQESPPPSNPPKSEEAPRQEKEEEMPPEFYNFAPTCKPESPPPTEPPPKEFNKPLSYFHRECQLGKCILVKGKGKDTCKTNTNCTHSICQVDKCIRVAGSDFDKCFSDSDCTSIVSLEVSLEASPTQIAKGEKTKLTYSSLTTTDRIAPSTDSSWNKKIAPHINSSLDGSVTVDGSVTAKDGSAIADCIATSTDSVWDKKITPDAQGKTSGSDEVTLNKVQTYKFSYTCYDKNNKSKTATAQVVVGECPEGEEFPHEVCKDEKCVSVASCGKDTCDKDEDCGECPEGEESPHEVCKDEKCVSVASCGKDTCDKDEDCETPPVCSVTLEAVPRTIFLGKTLDLKWSPVNTKECWADTFLLKDNQKITIEDKRQGGGWYGVLLDKEENEQLYNNTEPKSPLNVPHISTLKPTARGNYIYTISCDCGAEAETGITTEEEVEVKVIPVPYWREIIPVLPGFLRGLFNR